MCYNHQMSGGGTPCQYRCKPFSVLQNAHLWADDDNGVILQYENK